MIVIVSLVPAFVVISMSVPSALTKMALVDPANTLKSFSVPVSWLAFIVAPSLIVAD